MPRLKVTLTDEQHALLQFVASATGQSMSAILQELFETAAPVLRRVAEVTQAAREAPEAFRKGMLASLEAAEARLAPMVEGTQAAFDKVAVEAVELSKRPARPAGGTRRAGGGRRARGAVQPPSGNTGVRSSKSAFRRGSK